MTANFRMLPEHKASWRTFGASAVAQCALLAFLLLLPLVFPQKLVPQMLYNVIPLTTARTEVSLPPKPAAVRPKPRPAPKPAVQPKFEANRLLVPAELMAPRVRPQRMTPAEIPKVGETFKAASLNLPAPEMARPKAPIVTGVLSTGSAAPATVRKPLHEVQTGGFGDPNGLPGEGNPNKAANVAHKGSFDLPGGPGYGNGTGGSHGVRGTVQSAGFGNGIAIPPAGKRSDNRNVQSAGFSDASVTQDAPRARRTAPEAETQPVEILSKPRPTYTREAMQLKIEGEVLIDVVFEANGRVRVIRVTRGLGHGLDEAAMRAAEQIRFKPAQREGRPVDFPAIVHIVFQLAY